MTTEMISLVDLRDVLLDVVFACRFDTPECDVARAKVDAFDAAHPDARRQWENINFGKQVL